MSAPAWTAARRALLGAMVGVCLCSPLWAADPQGSGTPPARAPGRAHAFQVSFGADWLAADAIGTRDATMTTNSASGGSTTLFSNRVTRRSAPAFRVRLGYRLTGMVSIEGGFIASRGTLEDAVVADADQAPSATVTGTLAQYVVDVSVVARLPRLAFAGGAAVPFVEGGGGYLRQMQEGNVALNTGQIYHFGGGVTYMFARRPGSPAGIGVRADAQLYVRHKGFTVAGNTQGVFGALGAGLVVAF